MFINFFHFLVGKKFNVIAAVIYLHTYNVLLLCCTRTLSTYAYDSRGKS